MSSERDTRRDPRDDDVPRIKKDPPRVDNMFTLKVDNIPSRSTPEFLKEEFQEFGEIGDVYIPRNFQTQESRGFAFVRFIEREDAERAQRAMDGKMIDGREIRIAEARERRADNPREAMQQRLGQRNDYRDRDNRGGGGGYRGRDSGGYDRDRYDRRGYDDRDYRRDQNSRSSRGYRDGSRDRGGSSRRQRSESRENNNSRDDSRDRRNSRRSRSRD